MQTTEHENTLSKTAAAFINICNCHYSRVYRKNDSFRQLSEYAYMLTIIRVRPLIFSY